MTEVEYRDWLKTEIIKPHWHVGRPPDFNGVPDDHMFGTCFNDDCEGGIMEVKDLGRWRRLSRDGLVTYQGFCYRCTQRLVYGRDAHIDGSVVPSESDEPHPQG